MIHAPREDRVRKSCEKLTKAVNSKQQGRIDGFFTVKPKEPTASSSKSKTKGGKDDSKTKSTKRKVCSLLCGCRVPTEVVAFRQKRRRRRVMAQRRRGRKNDLRSSKTYIPCSRGCYSYVTCIFMVSPVYHAAPLSPNRIFRWESSFQIPSYRDQLTSKRHGNVLTQLGSEPACLKLQCSR